MFDRSPTMLIAFVAGLIMITGGALYKWAREVRTATPTLVVATRQKISFRDLIKVGAYILFAWIAASVVYVTFPPRGYYLDEHSWIEARNPTFQAWISGAVLGVFLFLTVEIVRFIPALFFSKFAYVRDYPGFVKGIASVILTGAFIKKVWSAIWAMALLIVFSGASIIVAGFDVPAEWDRSYQGFLVSVLVEIGLLIGTWLCLFQTIKKLDFYGGVQRWLGKSSILRAYLNVHGYVFAVAGGIVAIGIASFILALNFCESCTPYDSPLQRTLVRAWSVVIIVSVLVTGIVHLHSKYNLWNLIARAPLLPAYLRDGKAVEYVANRLAFSLIGAACVLIDFFNPFSREPQSNIGFIFSMAISVGIVVVPIVIIFYFVRKRRADFKNRNVRLEDRLPQNRLE